MQFKGKIIEALPVVTGQGARGTWVKQGFVLEYEPGQYPKRIAFDVFGSDKLQEFRISVGEELICDIDFKVVKGKNGGTFNNVDCWRVTRVTQMQQQAQAQAAAQPQQQAVQQQQQGCQPYYPNQQPQQAPPQQQPLYPPQGQAQQPVGDVSQAGSDSLPF
jgi:hypothetical protein